MSWYGDWRKFQFGNIHNSADSTLEFDFASSFLGERKLEKLVIFYPLSEELKTLREILKFKSNLLDLGNSFGIEDISKAFAGCYIMFCSGDNNSLVEWKEILTSPLVRENLKNNGLLESCEKKLFDCERDVFKYSEDVKKLGDGCLLNSILRIKKDSEIHPMKISRNTGVIYRFIEETRKYKTFVYVTKMFNLSLLSILEYSENNFGDSDKLMMTLCLDARQNFEDLIASRDDEILGSHPKKLKSCKIMEEFYLHLSGIFENYMRYKYLGKVYDQITNCSGENEELAEKILRKKKVIDVLEKKINGKFPDRIWKSEIGMEWIDFYQNNFGLIQKDGKLNKLEIYCKIIETRSFINKRRKKIKYCYDNFEFYTVNIIGQLENSISERKVIFEVPETFDFQFIEFGNGYCLTLNPLWTSVYLLFYNGEFVVHWKHQDIFNNDNPRETLLMSDIFREIQLVGKYYLLTTYTGFGKGSILFPKDALANSKLCFYKQKLKIIEHSINGVSSITYFRGGYLCSIYNGNFLKCDTIGNDIEFRKFKVSQNEQIVSHTYSEKDEFIVELGIDNLPVIENEVYFRNVLMNSLLEMRDKEPLCDYSKIMKNLETHGRICYEYSKDRKKYISRKNGEYEKKTKRFRNYDVDITRYRYFHKFSKIYQKFLLTLFYLRKRSGCYFSMISADVLEHRIIPFISELDVFLSNYPQVITFSKIEILRKIRNFPEIKILKNSEKNSLECLKHLIILGNSIKKFPGYCGSWSGKEIFKKLAVKVIRNYGFEKLAEDEKFIQIQSEREVFKILNLLTPEKKENEFTEYYGGQLYVREILDELRGYFHNAINSFWNESSLMRSLLRFILKLKEEEYFKLIYFYASKLLEFGSSFYIEDVFIHECIKINKYSFNFFQYISRYTMNHITDLFLKLVRVKGMRQDPKTVSPSERFVERYVIVKDCESRNLVEKYFQCLGKFLVEVLVKEVIPFSSFENFIEPLEYLFDWNSVNLESVKEHILKFNNTLSANPKLSSYFLKIIEMVSIHTCICTPLIFQTLSKLPINPILLTSIVGNIFLNLSDIDRNLVRSYLVDYFFRSFGITETKKSELLIVVGSIPQKRYEEPTEPALALFDQLSFLIEGFVIKYFTPMELKSIVSMLIEKYKIYSTVRESVSTVKGSGHSL